MGEGPLVLISDPVLARMEPILSATYRVRRLWEEDRAALLAEVGEEIAAIVQPAEHARISLEPALAVDRQRPVHLLAPVGRARRARR